MKIIKKDFYKWANQTGTLDIAVYLCEKANAPIVVNSTSWSLDNYSREWHPLPEWTQKLASVENPQQLRQLLNIKSWWKLWK